jgi:alpha-1,6-mannosyltransferase
LPISVGLFYRNAPLNRESGCKIVGSSLPKPGASWGRLNGTFPAWLLGGVALMGLHGVLTWLSGEFEYTRPLTEKPVLTSVAVQIVAGAVFLAVIFRTKFTLRESKSMLPWLIGIGIALRAMTIFSTPMLETDFYRYMWDGAVLANGTNPYKYAPDQAEDATASRLPELAKLAKASGAVIHRINHPDLRTIYPPMAEVFFAAAYFIKPWSLLAWRFVLAVFDAAVLLLLLLVLRNLNLPCMLAAIYWWNPLVIREVFNTAHMDVMALPFVMLAVMLSASNRYSAAAVALSGAVGVKLWPVVLLPVILSPLWVRPARLIRPVCLFAAACAVMFLPVYCSGFDQNSGFIAYGKTWEMNDAFYMLLLWIVRLVAHVYSWSEGATQLFTRAIVAATVVAWTAWLSMERRTEQTDLWERSLLVVSAVFLLSPTQFPWYYLWIVPFLAIRPRVSLLLLTALLSLYYLRFYFKAKDRVAIFDYYIVWLEYVPVWLLLLREWWKAHEINAFTSLEGESSPGQE